MSEDISSKLRDIHLPDGVAWWPLGPGWWILIIGVIVAGLFGVWMLKRKPHMQRLPHAAFAQAQVLIDNLYKQCMANNTPGIFIREYSVLMRRIILNCYPRSQVSSLTGDAWLKLLDEGLEDKPFSNGSGRCLLTLPYQNAAQQEQGSIHCDINIKDLYQVSMRKLEQLRARKTHV